MHSKLMLIVLVVACSFYLSFGHPQLFAVEQEDELAEPQQQEVYEEDVEPVIIVPVKRTRRDSIASADGHHSHGHHGWGWPKKQQGWSKGWGSVGPVFTYVKTDGWSNFQWGVRHKAGKGWGK